MYIFYRLKDDGPNRNLLVLCGLRSIICLMVLGPSDIFCDPLGTLLIGRWILGRSALNLVSWIICFYGRCPGMIFVGNIL